VAGLDFMFSFSSHWSHQAPKDGSSREGAAHDDTDKARDDIDKKKSPAQAPSSPEKKLEDWTREEVSAFLVANAIPEDMHGSEWLDGRAASVLTVDQFHTKMGMKFGVATSVHVLFSSKSLKKPCFRNAVSLFLGYSSVLISSIELKAATAAEEKKRKRKVVDLLDEDDEDGENGGSSSEGEDDDDHQTGSRKRVRSDQQRDWVQAEKDHFDGDSKPVVAMGKASKEQQAAVEQLWDSLFAKKEFTNKKAILAANGLATFRRDVYALSRKLRWNENISTAKWLGSRLKNHASRMVTFLKKGKPFSEVVVLTDDDQGMVTPQKTKPNGSPPTTTPSGFLTPKTALQTYNPFVVRRSPHEGEGT